MEKKPHKFFRKWEEQDLTEWEIDEKGNLCYVVWDENHPHCEKLRYGKYDMELYNWLLEHTSGDFFYDTEFITKGKNTAYLRIIYFEKYHDAFLFKLTWS